MHYRAAWAIGHMKSKEVPVQCVCSYVGREILGIFFFKSDIAAGENMIEAPTNEDK